MARTSRKTPAISCTESGHTPPHTPRTMSAAPMTPMTRAMIFRVVHMIRQRPAVHERAGPGQISTRCQRVQDAHQEPVKSTPCLLYTSDAADEEDSVDLGGRRIIKK